MVSVTQTEPEPAAPTERRTREKQKAEKQSKPSLNEEITAGIYFLSAGMDQGTASGARHDGRCQSFLDQNVSGAISAQARSCMIVFYQ